MEKKIHRAGGVFVFFNNINGWLVVAK